MYTQMRPYQMMSKEELSEMLQMSFYKENVYLYQLDVEYNQSWLKYVY